MALLQHFDFANFFTFSTMGCMFLGTFVGMLIGALPGLGATIAIVILLPLTYNLELLDGIILLLAGYQAAEYGGSISAVILGIPGTPAAVPTVLDGYSLAKKSSPGKALGYSLLASTIGGLMGALALIFISTPLAAFAMKMADPEYFLIALIGLCAATGLSSASFNRTMISVAMGILLACVGTDLFTGSSRFVFGNQHLTEGIKVMALIVGMFAFTEIFGILVSRDLGKKIEVPKGSCSTHITWKEFCRVWKSILMGGAMGTCIGCIPGLGAPMSAWMSYAAIQKVGHKDIPYGQGNPDGICAPESGNNAAVGGNMIPMMVLGIPGNPTIAIVMSAFIINGMSPGPRIFTERPEMVALILVGFFFTTVAMYIAGRLLTSLFARCLGVPNEVLMPVVAVISIVGAYAADVSYFFVGVALFCGVIAFFLQKLKFSMASVVLAFVLGPMLEEKFRRAMLISDGSLSVFITRPYSRGIVIAIVIFAIIFAGFKIHKSMNKKKNNVATTA